jgi:VCBS repeat-containing protein
LNSAIRIFTVVVVGLALVGAACAADVQGFLIDRMCSGDIVKKNDQKAAQAHTVACSLMPDCTKSGFGVFTADGKYITFDAAGNEKAVQALKAAKKKDDVRVVVSGEQTGATIKVTSIKLL